MEIFDYFRIIIKRLWLILLIVIISTLVTVAYSNDQYRPVYGATTKLIVGNTQDQGRLINIYKEIILTPAIMDVVVERHPELQISSKQLVKDVRINSLNGTQIMSIFIEDYSYVRAAKIVNAVAQVFQTESPRLVEANTVKVLSIANELEQSVSPLNERSNEAAIVSFMISLLFGIGFTILLEFMDNTLKSEKDIQQIFDSPILAKIIKTKDKHNKRGQSAKSRKKAGEVNGTAYSALNR